MTQSVRGMAPLNRLRRAEGARWRTAVLAIALVSAAGCASGGAASGVANWPARADVVTSHPAFTEQGLAALNARMKQAVDNGEVAGLAHLLLKDGRVANFEMYGSQSYGGPAITEETIYRIRSMTKPVVGVAMMQLYEQGLWNPEDPITKFLPEMENLRVATSREDLARTVPVSRPPTMNELMTHTAGFGYGLTAASAVDREFIANSPTAQPDMDSMVGRTAEIPLHFQPGERWSYSIAVDLQGAIVERLSGQPLGEYLDEHIFTPLGMDDTGFRVAAADRDRFATVYQRDSSTGEFEVYPDAYSFFEAETVESGGGGLVSTIGDYARFAQMLLNEGELDGRRILRPETVRLMMSNQIGDLRGGFGNYGFGYGGTVVVEPPSERSPYPLGTFAWFGIDGTWFWVDPANELAFVGMIQRRGGGGQGAVNLRGESAMLVYEALRE